jgi:peptidoglycan pentaglycine glycine transferase (the first glycine)
MLSRESGDSCSYNQTSWNSALERLGGDLLQSWHWGQFKQRHGWMVERIRVEAAGSEAMAQVLFRRRGPITVGYLPRGPVFADSDAVGQELLSALDETCRRFRAIVLVVEPKNPLPRAWLDNGREFAGGPASFQTSRTVKVPLVDDAELLAQMRKDIRYNVLYARRRGVVVEHASVVPPALSTFYQLLQETSQRSGFGIHARAYYEDFLRIFGNQATLLFSRVDGEVTAGLISVRFGNEGRSMYAGSSLTRRGRGDAALLRFEAMQWARGHGCTHFDLGGIAPDIPAPAQGRNDGAGRQRHSELEGVHRFKVGFGGEIISYPPTVERRYRPAMAWLVRRLHPRFRPAPQTEANDN